MTKSLIPSCAADVISMDPTRAGSLPPLHGMLMEVITEKYDGFYKKKNRQLYLKKQSASVGGIS